MWCLHDHLPDNAGIILIRKEHNSHYDDAIIVTS